MKFATAKVKTEVIGIRVTIAEYRELQDRAIALGVSLSQYIRLALDAYDGREEK